MEKDELKQIKNSNGNLYPVTLKGLHNAILDLDVTGGTVWLPVTKKPIETTLYD